MDGTKTIYDIAERCRNNEESPTMTVRNRESSVLLSDADGNDSTVSEGNTCPTCRVLGMELEVNLARSNST